MSAFCSVLTLTNLCPTRKLLTAKMTVTRRLEIRRITLTPKTASNMTQEVNMFHRTQPSCSCSISDTDAIVLMMAHFEGPLQVNIWNNLRSLKLMLLPSESLKDKPRTISKPFVTYVLVTNMVGETNRSAGQTLQNNAITAKSWTIKWLTSLQRMRKDSVDICFRWDWIRSQCFQIIGLKCLPYENNVQKRS
jgi:hypothetical protein